MARKRFNHSKLKVVGKKRKLYTGDWLYEGWNPYIGGQLYPDTPMIGFTRKGPVSLKDKFITVIPKKTAYGRPLDELPIELPNLTYFPIDHPSKIPINYSTNQNVSKRNSEKVVSQSNEPIPYESLWENSAENENLPSDELSYTIDKKQPFYNISSGQFAPQVDQNKAVEKQGITEYNISSPTYGITKKKSKFWKNLGKGIESIASKTSSSDPQDPSNAFFGGKYVAGVELGMNLFGKKYDRGVKGAQTVNSIFDALPLEQMGTKGTIIKAAGKDLAALAQQAWGYKYNDENIAKVEDATAAANNNTATYNNYDAIMNANFNHAFNFSNKYIGDQGWLSHGIDDKADELRLLSDRADKREKLNLATSIDQTSDAFLRALNRNWTAYGGRLRRPHKFVEGGAVVNTGNPSDIGGGWFSDMGNLFSKGWFQHAGKGVSSMYKSGQLNGVISAAGDFAYKGLSGGMNTNVGVGNAMNKLGDVAAMVPGPYGAIASAALKTVGGLTNRMFGSKLNYENINEVKGDIAAANANTATLNDYDSIMNNNWNNANYVSKSYIGKDGWFSNKAKKTWRRLMTQVGRAQDREQLAQATSTEQVGMNTMKGLERQWAAYGGKLNRYGNGGRVNKFDGTEESQIEREPHSLNENGEYLYTLPDGRTAVADRKGNLISFDNEGHTKVAGSNLNYIQELPEVVLEQNPETVISDNFNKSDIAKLYRRDRPLEMISPEFDLLTLARSLGWNGLKALRHPIAKLDDPKLYYRQVGKDAIEDMEKTRIVRSNPKGKETIFGTEHYVGPYFMNGRLFVSQPAKWRAYGMKGIPSKDMPKYLIVGRNNLKWQPLTSNVGVFVDSLAKSGGRATPLYKGAVNQTPAKYFTTYEWNPSIEQYINTDLRIPLTGLDFLFDSADHAEGGNLRAGLDTALNNRIAMNKRAYNTRSAYNANGVPVINVPNLNVPYANGGDIDDFTEYGLGGRIKIKKENRGKFTKSAKRAGMSVQQYAKHVLANPDKYSPQERKRANFAKNASKWKHALGGDLYNALAYGGWTAPVNRFDTGGRTNWYDYNYADVKNHYRQQGVKGKNAETLDQVVDQLNESGLSEAAKKAILQTIYRESGFNAGAHNNIAGGHTGLIQYSGDRWNALKDRSVRGQVENIIGSITNPVMGRDVIASYLPQGVRSSQDAAQFFSGITNPQDFMYYWNSSSIRNGGDAKTAMANARAMANSGAYLDQNGNLTGYTPGTSTYEQRPYVNYDELKALSQMLNNPEGLGIEGYVRASNNDSPAIMADMQAQEEMSKRQQVENTAALLGLPTIQDLAAQAFGLDNARTQAAQDNSFLGSYFRLMNGGSNGVLSFGGELGTQGGNFTNGLLSIDEGGSHESNPLEGVPMGTDNQGTPNVVEEGETIYNDYVFSKRLYLPAELKNKYHLGGKRKKITFAEASKKLAEESRERPNDPISKDGLDMFMQELRDAQEDVKMKKQQDKMLALQEMMQAMGGVPVGPQQQPMPMQQGQPGIPGGMDQQAVLMAMMGGGQEAAPEEEGEPTEEGEEEVPEEETNYAAYGGRLNKFAGDLLGTLTNPVEYPGLVYDDATSLYTLDPNYNITGLKWDAENANAAYQNLTSQLLSEFATAYQNAADDAAKQKLQKSYIGQAIAEAYKFNNSENTGHKDFDWSTYNADDIKSDWFNNLTYTLTEKPKPAEEMDTRIIDALAAAQKPTNMGNIPTIMSGLQVLGDALGFNGPDYTEADALVRRGINGTYQRVTPTLISEKRKFVPLDENAIANSIRAKHAGNMRMIANTAGNNRGLLEAAMLADRSSYGTGTSAISELADAYATAREYNDKTRGEVAEFNRGTDQANAQAILQAQQANQSAGLKSRELSYAMIMKGMALRQAERQAVDEAHGKNLSSFMTNLENQYKSNLAYNQLLMVAAAGGFGNLDPKILGAWLGVDLPETDQKETETETTPTVTYQSLNQGAAVTPGTPGTPVTPETPVTPGTPETPAYNATKGGNYFGASAGFKTSNIGHRPSTQNIGFGLNMPSINIGYNVPSQDVRGNTYQVGKSSNPSSVTGTSSTATQKTASKVSQTQTAGQKAAEGSDLVTSKLAGKQPSSFRLFKDTDLGDGIKVNKRGWSSVNVWQNGKCSIYDYDRKTGKWALRENGVRNNGTDNPNSGKKQASTNTNNSGTSSTNI